MFELLKWELEMEKKREVEDDIMPDAMDPRTAVDLLYRYLYASDPSSKYISPDPISDKQIVCRIVYMMLNKLSDTYKHEKYLYQNCRYKIERIDNILVPTKTRNKDQRFFYSLDKDKTLIRTHYSLIDRFFRRKMYFYVLESDIYVDLYEIRKFLVKVDEGN